ncbi:Rhodanese-like protein [Rhizodiscina lignyota]|uniref:Rhodanese-like protein n=1 Tax=Rhizodiscina lignyota TaxID=1504668 RepID=A0A9P4IS47_9PEZI|nr:Rhodanese-like protein [Rhizodiscina lignyota]
MSSPTTSYSLPSYLVTPSELSTALSKNIHSRLSTAPRIIPLSAAWFLPNDPQKRTGWGSYVAKRIPHSRFFDLDKVKDEESPYPHMLPTPEVFAREMGKLGIKRDDTVVVYDTAEVGIFSAPRVAWTLRVFGHPEVHLLNNFRAWVDEGYPVEEGEPSENVEEVAYAVPEMNNSMVVAFEEVKERVTEQGKEGAEEVQVLDARPEGRWKGTAPEPRKGLSPGHMPNSLNIPHTTLLDPKTGAFLPTEKLKQIFQEKGVDPSKPIISSCGTGVTATVVDTALTEAGFNPDTRQVYDGSWTEWAQRVKQGENLIVKEEN